MKIFLKVNKKVSEIKKSGYIVVRDVEERPLTNHIYFAECGIKLTSYENKKKYIHHYKCQKCNGVSINTATPATRARNISAHELFVKELGKYKLDDIFVDIYNNGSL